MRTVKVHFLGAAGTVTGSKFLVETPEHNILIDCGVFQGKKELRLRNWKTLPFDASKIDKVLLTHGHLDHVGYLPRLCMQGFEGEIIGTPPTLAIAEIILRDSAKIHEEEAEQANKEGYSKHHPALPFYTMEQAEETLTYFYPANRDEWILLSEHIQCRYRYNGHIIGSCFIELKIFDKVFVFSGDLGRNKDVLLRAPEKPRWADYLFLESTYGDRLHPEEDVSEILSSLIYDVIHERGTLIIPSFAVERLQVLMYVLWKLFKENKIPNIPIFIDSPMGNHVCDVFEAFPEWHQLTPNQWKVIEQHMDVITSYKDTWKTIDDLRPKVVIAGSGMVSGGRVLTYLKQLIEKNNTQILLVGFQAEGTRGRKLLEGAESLRIYGKEYPVNARIHHLDSLSAHGDQNDLMDWLKDIKNIPEKVFLIHGEPQSAATLGEKIQTTFHWNVEVPKLFEVVELLV